MGSTQKLLSGKNIKDPDPRKIFDDDICEDIKEWMDLGDNIVIGIGMNDDVRSSTFARRLEQLDLREAVLSSHPNASPLATFNRNKSRIPIDAIFVSPAVKIVKARYMPFDGKSPSAPSDGHRMLWVEISCSSILGKDVPFSTHPIDSNFGNASDPRVRKSLSIKVKKEYTQQNMFNIKHKLEAQKLAFFAGKIEDIDSFIKHFSIKFNKFHSKTRDIKK